MASIIDDDDTWIAGNDTLVQTGDMVDRGEPLLNADLAILHADTGHKVRTQ